MNRKGQAGIIGGVVALVILVVGLVVLDSVIPTQTWNNSLTTTIATYVVPIGMLGGLVGAAMLAARKR